MKRILILIVIAVVCVSCLQKVTQTQHGVVTDVKYHPAHTTIIMVPMRCGKVTTYRPQPINHAEQWVADVCYEDTIYVNQVFMKEIAVGDSVTREVVIGHTLQKPF